MNNHQLPKAPYSVFKMFCDGLLKDKQSKELEAYSKQENPTLLSTANPQTFCAFMALRKNGDYGEVLYGQAEFARSLIRNCYVGILKDPKELAAVLIGRNNEYAMCLYTPKEVAETL